MPSFRLMPFVLVGALGLAACGSSGGSGGSAGSAGAGTNNPYTIGIIDATTGTYGPVGIDELDGVKLAIKQINASGGVNGHKLKLQLVDDQGSVSLSTVGFKRLALQDQIPVILGPGITPPAEADAPLAQQYKAVELNYVAQSDTWQNRPYVFAMVTPQTLLADAMVKYMTKVEHVTKAEILYANVPFGVLGMKELKAAAKQHGLTITGTNSWDVTKFDFTSQAAQVASANPEGLFLWGAGTPSDAQALKAVRAQGYTGKIVGDVTYAEGDIPKIAGDKASSSVVGMSQINYAQPNAGTKSFLTAFKSSYGHLPDYLAGASYDSIHILKKAIEKARSYNAAAIDKALIGLSYSGVNGSYNFSSKYRGGPGEGSYVAVTFKNGQYVLAATS